MTFDLGICFVSSYPPRKCGIATFTNSIVEEIETQNGHLSKIVSVNDGENNYDYGNHIIAEISHDQPETYKEAAKIINNDPEINVVSLQHVFSLFGEDNGKHILDLLVNLKKPVFTTLHMVYSRKKKPAIHEVVGEDYVKLTKKIYELSEKLIVMIQPMKDILVKEYGFDKNKIIVVPHGAPVEITNPLLSLKFKKKYGYEENKIISTFGLIRPKKGLEYVIYAMPAILEKYPESLFLVLGRNHPNRSNEYYQFLKSEVKKLGLEQSVVFKNEFLSFEEIKEHLLLTDVFVTPYLVAEQTSSGVIAYAMGCGKAIISTPFLYAKEVLSEKRGLFVNYEDPESIFKAMDFLFSYPEKRRRMENLVMDFAKNRSWSKITNEYIKIFNAHIKK